MSDLNIARRVLARYLSGALVNPDEVIRKLRQNLDVFDADLAAARKLQELMATVNKLMARGSSSAEEADRIVNEVESFKKEYQSINVKVLYGYICDFHEMHMLAMAVLQKYSLPPALRKKVEGISRFWATKQTGRKPRMPSGYGVERMMAVVTYYLKYVEDTQEQLGVLTEAMAKGQLIAEGDADDVAKVKAGPFTLINTGGFSEDVMKTVADVVKKAADYASTSGVGQVCYGEVHVTNKISKGNVLAFYMISQDEMFVRADASTSEKHMHTLLHELGHRYQYKFLKNKQAIERMYSQIKYKWHRDEILKMKPQKGETLTDPKSKKVYVVESVSGDMVHMRTEHSPEVIQVVKEQARETVLKKRPELATPRNPAEEQILQYSLEAMEKEILRRVGVVSAKINIEGYYQMKGVDPRALGPDFKGFITPYAATDPDENFAEMFGFYCTGDLPPTQSALFEQEVLNGGGSNDHPLGQPLW